MSEKYTTKLSTSAQEVPLQAIISSEKICKSKTMVYHLFVYTSVKICPSNTKYLNQPNRKNTVGLKIN
jgi:hypothetical protein